MFTKKITWLSLIEVLIAILVFAVGILAVLQLTVRTLTSIHQIQLRSQGTQLAAQWLELMETIRNTNIQKWLPRDCIQGEIVQGAYTCLLDFRSAGIVSVAMNHEQIDSGSQPYMAVATIQWGDDRQLWEQARMFLHTGSLWWSAGEFSWFDHDQSGTPTAYARYIEFQPVPTLSQQAHDYVVRVVSHVMMRQWSYEGSVVLETLLGKVYE